MTTRNRKTCDSVYGFVQQNIKLGQELLLKESHTTNSYKQKIHNTFQDKYILSIDGSSKSKRMDALRTNDRTFH